MTEKIAREATQEDIDSLDIDLDTVDLDAVDNELDNMDLSGFGEVDDTMTVPHLKTSTKMFKEFLKVAKQVASSSGRDVVSKSVAICAEGDKFVCRVTDFDVYLEQKLELLNVDNILTDPVIIPIDILIKVTKATPANTVIFKDGDNFKMKLVSGEIPLETFNVDVEKFKFNEPLAKDCTVSAANLYGTMKDFGGVVTAAVSPTERRIICEPTKAYANYMWAILASNKTFADMDLKIKDISVLKTLTLGSEEELDVSTTTQAKVVRKVISGSNFSYAFLVSDVKVSDTLKNNMDGVLTNEGVYVDFLQFYKLIELAAELPYSISKVGLNYSEDGIKMAIKTKKDSDSMFNISGSVNGAITALANELVLQAKLLKIVLRCFAGQSSIKLSLTDKGLGISTDDYTAVVYSESV